MSSTPNAFQWLVATAVDPDTIGLKFDCGMEIIITPASRSGQASLTKPSQREQLESGAAVKRRRSSQKKAEVALRREKRCDQYKLSHVKLPDHAIYARRAPGAKDATKPVLKMERLSNLSDECELAADVEAEAAAAAGELEQDMADDVLGKGLPFEPDVSWCQQEAVQSFALPSADCLDAVFPLPPSLQASPCSAPSAPPLRLAPPLPLPGVLTNPKRLEVPLPAAAAEAAAEAAAAAAAEAAAPETVVAEQQATEQATESAEAREEEAAAEEAALDGWVLVSPAQLPHSAGAAGGGAISMLRPTSLLHSLHSLVLGHGAAAVPHGPKEVGAWVFVPPSRLRHEEPSAATSPAPCAAPHPAPTPEPAPTPAPSPCAAAAPEAIATADTADTAGTAGTGAPAPAAPTAAPTASPDALLEGVLAADAVLEAVRALHVAEPELGLKPLLAKLRAGQPGLAVGTKEVRKALAALKAETEAKAAAAPADAARDYLGAVLQQKPPLPMPPRAKPPPVLRGLQPAGRRAGSGAAPLHEPPELEAAGGEWSSVAMERHCALLEPLAKRPRRDPRPRSILMQRQRAFSMEQRAMRGATAVAAC